MENLTGGNPPVRPLPCVVPCKLYFTGQELTSPEIGIMTKMLLKHYTDGMRVPNTDFRFQMLMS